MADQCNVNVLFLSLQGVPDNRKYEFLDHMSGAILQVIETLSFREFGLPSVRDGIYTSRPVLFIRKPVLTPPGPLISFCNAEVLFPEKRRGYQLRAGRIWLCRVDGPSGIVCAEERGSNNVGEGCCGQRFSNSFSLLFGGEISEL